MPIAFLKYIARLKRPVLIYHVQTKWFGLDDIQVRFYQETEDGVSWEAYGDFASHDVHRQVMMEE